MIWDDNEEEEDVRMSKIMIVKAFEGVIQMEGILRLENTRREKIEGEN